MQTRSLKSLVKISHVQSFSDAAEQLGMTLPALSMQMKSLEEALGAELFDRSVRPPRLTPVARAIVEEAVPLLRHEDNLIEICRQGGGLAGKFRLGFVTTAAVRLLPGFLQTASRELPQASFEFETGLSASLQQKVVSGLLDAAIITDADGLPSQLASEVLRQEPFVFAARKDLLDQGLPSLLSEGVFFHFMPDTGIGKLIARVMVSHERPAQSKTVVLDNLEAIMECVSAGLGFTLLPVPDVERYRAPDLVVLDAKATMQRKLVLVTLRDSVLDRYRSELASSLGRTSNDGVT